jgi:HEAT repeat protein
MHEIAAGRHGICCIYTGKNQEVCMQEKKESGRRSTEVELDRLFRGCLRPDPGVNVIALLKSHCSDRRTAVRRRVAEVAGMSDGLEVEVGEDLIRRLAGDPVEEVREAAAEGLGLLLRRAGQMDRTRIVGEWATSNDSFQREAIAKSLRQHLHVLGDAPAIEHLSNDPDASVREATVDAATVRSPSRPERYTELLERLSRDECDSVRLAAAEGLADTAKRVPDEALEAYEVLADAEDELDPRVLEEAVPAILRLQQHRPVRSRQILRKLAQRREPGVRRAARSALEQGEGSY